MNFIIEVVVADRFHCVIAEQANINYTSATTEIRPACVVPKLECQAWVQSP